MSHANLLLNPSANFKLARKAQEVVRLMLKLENLNAEDTPSSFLFGSARENERRWTCGNCVIVPMARQDLVSSFRTSHPVVGLLILTGCM